MPGSFVHLELNTDDTDRAKEFYQQLFGWDYTEWPMGDSIYWGVKTPEPPGGGIQTKPMPHAPTQWIPYISVDDIHDTVARARSAGAEIIVDFMDIGGGQLAIVRDPTGATIGLWKQVTPTNGQSDGASASSAAAKTTKKKSGKKAGAKTSAASKAAPAKKGAAKKGAAKKGAAKKGAAKKAAAPAPAPNKTSGKKSGQKPGKKSGKKKG